MLRRSPIRRKCSICSEAHSFAEKATGTNPHFFRFLFPRRNGRVNPISRKQRKVLSRLAAIRRRWWRESERSGIPLICYICGLPILNFSDLNSDHIIPGKMGGCKDHRESNLGPAHEWCNQEKGSKRQ